MLADGEVLTAHNEAIAGMQSEARPVRPLTAICLVAWSFGASATPVLWTVDSVLQFDDGGIGYGSFIYDADTNSYSELAIGTTAGDAQPGSFYAYVRGAASSATQVFLLEDPERIDGTHAFFIMLAGFLTNAGGSVELFPAISNEGDCVAMNPPFEECDGMRHDRLLIGGALFGTPLVDPEIGTIPVPAAFWLYGSVLMLLTFARTSRR